MSKAYKRGLCAYCCEAQASTADHVIARGFFPEDLRGNLPKVGACKECNNRKSQLEHKLTAVLPFGARHGRASETLLAVERKLAKNQPLHGMLSRGIRYAFRSINGCPWFPEMSIPLEGNALEELGTYIVKGLARHHWNLDIGNDTLIRASFLRREGSAMFEQLFSLNANDRVSCDLGQGVFKYEGVRSGDSPNLTLWKMSIYGAVVGGDSDAPEQRVSIIYGVTVARNSRAAKLLSEILPTC